MNWARSAVAARVVACLAFATLVSCKDDPPTTPTQGSIADYLSAVQSAAGVAGALKTGDVPAAGNGPVVNVTGETALIRGGSAPRTVTGSTSFNKILVAIEGVSGYYELTLPGNATSQDIVLTVAQQPPRTTFNLRFAAAAGSAVGTYDVEPVTTLQVGTGDVQVSVAWDTDSDVDLHVVDPAGEEIYYGSRVSTSGGRLDLDSNAGCDLDSPRRNQENITWPAGGAPRGQYTVRVDYWSACNVSGTTRYTVTVRVAGRQPQIFSGSFTPADADQGGEGDGRLVTQFTY